MLYEFRHGKNAVKATEAICSIYCDDALSVRVCQNSFARFRNGNLNLNDEERSGRPQELEVDALQGLLNEDPRQSTWEMAERLQVFHKTVLNRLHEMGKILKAGT
jgi:transposase